MLLIYLYCVCVVCMFEWILSLGLSDFDTPLEKVYCV